MPSYYGEAVVDQAPPAGQAARRGSRVNMTVGGIIPREIVFIPIPPYPFPPPESYIRLRVEARDDDSGFAWANVFEVGEYESLGATPDITFPRSPSDSRTNMYGRGTNSL